MLATDMNLKLYVLPASHPCEAVEAALRLKGLEYDRVDLLPFVPVTAGRLLYGGSTVPGIRIDSERITGSRPIMRRLDELAAGPPLLPADPATRERVLEAERWGDEVLQAEVRRITWATLSRAPASIESYADGAKLPLPMSVLRPTLGVVSKLSARKSRAGGASGDARVQADLAALPGHLEKVDAWIADGTLGAGDTPNAADLQIGSSLRLLSSLGDATPLVASRPAARLVDYFPPMAGSVPAGVLPAGWVPAAA